MKAVAEACSNIALVKYFGKCDAELNLPAVPSLSLTLRSLVTQTEVHFDPSFQQDAFWLNDIQMTGPALLRVVRHLDLITCRASGTLYAQVRSWNYFPTAAGLASSASGFAALTVAANAAYARLSGTMPASLHSASPQSSPEQLRAMSILARQGSASAARSILGGAVLLGTGTPGQVDSSFATPVCTETEWPDLCIVIGIHQRSQKPISSTEAMNQTVATSPYYASFQNQANVDIREALRAIAQHDLEALGSITERSALRMHAAAFAADPGIVYFRGTTLDAFHGLRDLRQKGVPVWFTCDAGPNPKAFTLAVYASTVAAMLSALPGIESTVISLMGPGAKLVEEPFAHAR